MQTANLSVIKRNGAKEEVNFEKIHRRINWLLKNPFPLTKVNAGELAVHVVKGIRDGISTQEIDEYTAAVAASMSNVDLDYNRLAGRIVVNNLHKNTKESFKEKMRVLRGNFTFLVEPRELATGQIVPEKRLLMNPLVSEEFYAYVEQHQEAIQAMLQYDRDYLIDYFGFKTMERSYLSRVDGAIVDRPQDVFMRVAVFIHMGDAPGEALALIKETYDAMSQHYFTHATPTLFNAGTMRPQLASCFLLGSGDSLDGIMKTLKDSATISKYSGGIGFHFDWRASDSYIKGTHGSSNGPIPFLKIFNENMKAWDQGGGKRKGSTAVYMMPHHPNILDFLELTLNEGDDNARARDLFTALWIPDLFMKRVAAHGTWSLFDPAKCPALFKVYGEEFEKQYALMEEAGVYEKQVPAEVVWQAIFKSQKQRGIPYLLYSDAVNRHSNQKNIGMIRSSNLCAEIVIYSDDKEYGVCNLASICLGKFVVDTAPAPNHEFPAAPVFQYKELAKYVAICVRNLNKVIDKSWYPVPEAAFSNFKNRPIGIGVQGLADVFMKFRCSFESDKARELNRKIFETMYYAAVSESSKLARRRYLAFRDRLAESNEPFVVSEGGIKILDSSEWTAETLPTTAGAYATFVGSPLSEGQFHWESYGLKPYSPELPPEKCTSNMFDWESLRMHVQRFGVRNSLLIALMPTATTSQIMGNIESFEPYKNNIYNRKTLAGDFYVVNKYMMRDLGNLGMLNKEVMDYLFANAGSIQGIEGLPQEMRDLYKTVWEIKVRSYIQLARERQPFVDQTQSLNLFVSDLTFDKFTKIQRECWRSGLKTGCYYMRTLPAVEPIKFTLDPTVCETAAAAQKAYAAAASTSAAEEEEVCLICSS